MPASNLSRAKATISATNASKDVVSPPNLDSNSRGILPDRVNSRHGAFNNDVVDDQGVTPDDGSSANYEAQMVTNNIGNLATEVEVISNSKNDGEVYQFFTEKMSKISKETTDLTLTTASPNAKLDPTKVKIHLDTRKSMLEHPPRFIQTDDVTEISLFMVKFGEYLNKAGIASLIHYPIMKRISNNYDNFIIRSETDQLITELVQVAKLPDHDRDQIDQASNLRSKMLLFFDKIFPINDFIIWFETNNEDFLMDYKAFYAYYVFKVLSLNELTYETGIAKVNEIFVNANMCSKRLMRQSFKEIFVGCIIINKFFVFATNNSMLKALFPLDELNRRKTNAEKIIRTTSIDYNDDLGIYTTIGTNRLARDTLTTQHNFHPNNPRRNYNGKGYYKRPHNSNQSTRNSSKKVVITGEPPKQNNNKVNKNKKFNNKRKTTQGGNSYNLICLGDESLSDLDDDFDRNITVANITTLPIKNLKLNRKNSCLIDSGANRNFLFRKPGNDIKLYNINYRKLIISTGGQPLISKCTATADIVIGNHIIPINFIILDDCDPNSPLAILSTGLLDKFGVYTKISGSEKFIEYKNNKVPIISDHGLPYVNNLFASVKFHQEKIKHLPKPINKKYAPKRITQHSVTKQKIDRLINTKQSITNYYTKIESESTHENDNYDSHSSFGHISKQRINDTMKKANILKHVQFNLSEKTFNQITKNSKKNHYCEYCTLSKGRMSNKALRTNTYAKNVSVPFSHINIDSFNFLAQKYLTVVDVFSRCILVKLITKDYTVTDALIDIINNLYSMGYSVYTIIGDNDRAFHTNSLESYYKINHITFISSIAYFPKSNGLIERHQQIILNMAKAAILENNPPLESVPTIIEHCAFLNNCTFHKKIENIPFELAGMNIDVYEQDLTPLGSPIWYRLTNNNKGDKLYDNLLRQGIFLGRDVYSTSGYSVWCCQRKKVITVSDFHRRRLLVNPPTNVHNIILNYINLKMVLPTAVKEVLKVPTFSVMKHEQNWLQAIHKEYDNLLTREVLVESSITQEQIINDSNKILVPLKWVMVYKGAMAKARLVLRGDFLKNQYDDSTKYSPTISLEKVKTTIVTLLRCHYNFTISDVNQAFTLGSTSDYGIDVYSKLPAFYEINPNKSNYKTHTNPQGTTTKFLKLSKNLYGHPLAGIVFYKYLIGKAKSLGFDFVGNESCLLYNKVMDTFMLLYVDDVIIFDKNPDATQRLKLIKHLGEIGVEMKVTLEDSSNANDFTFIGLTCTLEQHNNVQTISFHKPVNVQKFFKTLYVTPTKRHADTPYFSLLTYEQASEPYTGSVTLRAVQEFVGYITYISQHRPDISFITNYLQIHLHTYNAHYLKIAGILVNYLHHNPIMKYRYTIDPDISNSIKVYTDSNHGGDFNRYSNGCIMIQIFGVLVLGKTSLNRVVSLSSTHAEIYTINKQHEKICSIVDLTKDILQIAHPQQHVIQPKIYIDNQAVIKILENSVRYKIKFQDIHISKFRNKLDEGNYGLYHIDTKMNIADIGTKPLPKVVFDRLLDLIADTSTSK